jgi:hypothetical protein
MNAHLILACRTRFHTMYRELDIEQVTATLEALQRRIRERFPEANLLNVCGELLQITEEAKSRTRWILKPHWVLRITVILLILLMIGSITTAIISLNITGMPLNLMEFIPTLESSLNDLILIGAGVFFLGTLESRVKRSKTLEALSELRAIAHVIDMHQLTKDPHRLDSERQMTASSPRSKLDHYELTRYLDYCSELLSLTAKVAAYYGQNLNEGVVLAAVNEVETLTEGLSRKIWQKIRILRSMDLGE